MSKNFSIEHVPDEKQDLMGNGDIIKTGDFSISVTESDFATPKSSAIQAGQHIYALIELNNVLNGSNITKFFPKTCRVFDNFASYVLYDINTGCMNQPLQLSVSENAEKNWKLSFLAFLFGRTSTISSYTLECTVDLCGLDNRCVQYGDDCPQVNVANNFEEKPFTIGDLDMSNRFQLKSSVERKRHDKAYRWWLDETIVRDKDIRLKIDDEINHCFKK